MPADTAAPSTSDADASAPGPTAAASGPAAASPTPPTAAPATSPITARATSLLLRAAGLFLLILPLMPLTRIFGEIPGDDFLPAPEEWILGLLIFGTVAWLTAMTLCGREGGLLAGLARVRVPGRAFVLAALLVLALLLGLTSAYAFRRHPLLVDSVVQLFQARIFASGFVTAPPPPLESFFLTQHMLIDERGWYAQYPPGHSALLALGVLAGVPWAVGILLSLGTAVLLFLFARRIYGGATAALTLALLVVCPFFWFMGASFMNHVSALFFIAASLYAFSVWTERRAARWLFLAGLALGAAFLSRPLDCVAPGLVFSTVALGEARRTRRWTPLVAGAIGFVLVASLYLLYNRLTTGDPFLPGYVKLWGRDHGLGFHETPWGDVHTPFAGLRNELLDLALLDVFLFEWPLPGLLPLAMLLAAGRVEDPWDRRLLFAFLGIPATYFFYWHRDAFLGPRFLYGGLAFLVPLTARALLHGLARLRCRSFRVGGLFRPANAAVFALALLALCFGYATLYGIPQRFRIYASGMRSMKVDVVREARRAGLEVGLLFVAESWGSRLLAQARGMGVPASLAEKAYRSSDHCRLDGLLRESARAGWPPAELARRIERLMAERGPLEKVNLAGDPTLRLRPGMPLAERCVLELLYDRQGFSLYTPHLPENRPTLDGAFIIARDLREQNAKLRALYPGKPAYRYRNGSFVALR